MLIAIGTNHKYSPIEVRERLSIPKGRLKTALAELTHAPVPQKCGTVRDFTLDAKGVKGSTNNECIKGAVILSTCNRIEVYADVEDAYEGIEVLKNALLARRGRGPTSVDRRDILVPSTAGFENPAYPNCWLSSEVGQYLYTYTGKKAIAHLFEVASGLDSQIIGEGQILDQLMSAWQEAKGIGATDDYLNMIFDKAVKVSFKVKEETDISSGNISIANIILDLINTEYGGIKDKKMLIIGVGKISELIVRQLKERQARAVFIANKTFEKARQLADVINAEVVRFDQLKERLKEADVVISATASPHFIINKQDLVSSIQHRPLLIVDLAVPRDVEPCIKDIQGITLFNLDDLNFIIERNLNRRIQEIPKAKNIIDKEVEALCSTGQLELEPEPALLR